MEKDVLERLFGNGLSIRQVEQECGVTNSKLRHWMKKHGIKSGRPKWNVKQHLCKGCGETDPQNFYGDRKEKCKRCFIADDVQIGVEKKIWAVELMGGCCVVCKYDKYYGALHFHHIDREGKEDWASLRNWGWERIEAELQKCILVCGNCHAEIHGGIVDDSVYKPGPRTTGTLACEGVGGRKKRKGSGRGKTRPTKYPEHAGCGCTETAREGRVGKRVSQASR